MLSKLSKVLVPIKDMFASSDVIPGVPTPSGTFVKGINFAGDAVTIERQAWDAYETALAQGLSVPGASAITTKIMPQPYVPAAVRQMLNGVVYKPQVLEINQPLANGRYGVYLWIMENYQTNWHALEIKLNGATVATEVGQLPMKHWERYGPYSVTVDQEMLHVAIATNNPNVDAHVMGMSIFQA